MAGGGHADVRREGRFLEAQAEQSLQKDPLTTRLPLRTIEDTKADRKKKKKGQHLREEPTSEFALSLFVLFRGLDRTIFIVYSFFLSHFFSLGVPVANKEKQTKERTSKHLVFIIVHFSL